MELIAFEGTENKHLLKQNARLHRTEEDDVLKVRNVDASRQHVHGDDNVRFRAIPKLADSLQRTINSACDFLDERISLAEYIASDIDKVVCMRSVRKIIHGEDQCFRKPT